MKDTIPKLLCEVKDTYPAIEAQLWKDEKGQYHPTTYSEFFDQVVDVAAGLHVLGVTRGAPVGLISDNRKEWLITDLAILSLGAADVPRGRDAMPYELAYILSFTGCEICFAENEEQTSKILDEKEKIPTLSTIIVMDPEYTAEEEVRQDVKIITFLSVVELGKKFNAKHPNYIMKQIEAGKESDIATIIFTSGTTGEPKGVMLSHNNFIHQLKQIPKIIDTKPGDRWLSVLPVWHSFERILQYVIIAGACTIAYSKPIGKIMLQDFQKTNPVWMGSVPRIWESIKTGVYQNVKKKSPIARGLFYFFVWAGATRSVTLDMVTGRMPQFARRIYLLDLILGIIPTILLTPFTALGNVLVFSSIKKKLGTSFRAGVSGGGSLPISVDKFFRAIGITLLDGYGLTETAPVIGIRPLKHPVASTVSPLPETEIKIVDDQGHPVRPGEKGLILARGPQVMVGYYKRPELTKAMIDSEGWLNTGDLGIWTHKGEFAIRGRAKDTIVLSGGENIEPVPIEARLRESEYIEQAVVLGQDQKYLAALIVPDTKQLELFMKKNNIPYISRDDVFDVPFDLPEITELINHEINECVSSKNGFKSFEHIYRFTLIKGPFHVGQELSAKQEIMRHKINEIYKKEIQALFR